MEAWARGSMRRVLVTVGNPSFCVGIAGESVFAKVDPKRWLNAANVNLGETYFCARQIVRVRCAVKKSIHTTVALAFNIASYMIGTTVFIDGRTADRPEFTHGG